MTSQKPLTQNEWQQIFKNNHETPFGNDMLVSRGFSNGMKMLRIKTMGNHNIKIGPRNLDTSSSEKGKHAGS